MTSPFGSSLTAIRRVPTGEGIRVNWRGWRIPSGTGTSMVTYWPGEASVMGVASAGSKVITATSPPVISLAMTRQGANGRSLAAPAYRFFSIEIRALAISQYTSVHASTTSGVAASPRSAAMAPNRCW